MFQLNQTNRLKVSYLNHHSNHLNLAINQTNQLRVNYRNHYFNQVIKKQ